MTDCLDGIKAVFLDVDDTLLDFGKCAKTAMYQAADRLGIKLPEHTEIRFHEINDMLWGKLQQGQISMKELHRVRWEMIFADIGVEADGEAFDRAFSGCLFDTAEPVDGAYRLLEELNGRVRMFVTSNASYEEQRNRLGKAGMLKYFEKMFVSDRIGYPKPQKEFFDACFRELPELRPEEVLMIGDSISSDISGAFAYGIRTCWFNKKKKSERPDCAEWIVESWE
ncbi:MAG: YjjG family noncanonical pyrimidine nucleotidase [Clostridia bacterium]|nr:YjjG family noncanonical pyrimidine nucleotidase [Clostridia bacterium]